MFRSATIVGALATLVVFGCSDDDEGEPTDAGSPSTGDVGSTPSDAGATGDGGPTTDGGSTTADATPPVEAETPPGLLSFTSTRTVDESVAEMEAAAQAFPGLAVVVTVDHEANAMSADLELAPTSVVVFGNPNLGTPLMQENQQVGLDLPQKLFAWTDADGQARVAYNSVEYLAERHGLADTEETLTTIAGALQMFARRAAGSLDGQPETPAPELPADLGNGIMEVASENNVEETFSALRDAVEDAEPLRVVAEVDHGANAESVGLELRPTRLLIFGNPAAGTPLMQSVRTVGIDLPQKMLVYEAADGTTRIAWNASDFLAARHGIEDQNERLSAIANALQGLAATAAAPR